MCSPTECPELKLDDEAEVPVLHKPCCSRGECEGAECLKARLELVRKCKTEFAESSKKVRFRKYAKMDRVRNDGTPYTEARALAPHPRPHAHTRVPPTAAPHTNPCVHSMCTGRVRLR